MAEAGIIRKLIDGHINPVDVLRYHTPPSSELHPLNLDHTAGGLAILALCTMTAIAIFIVESTRFTHVNDPTPKASTSS